MHSFIVYPDESNPDVAQLAQFLDKSGCTVQWINSLETLAAQPEFLSASDSLIIIPTTPKSTPGVHALVHFIRKSKGRGFFLYVTDEINPENYKALTQTGVADSVGWMSATKEIFSAVQRLKTGVVQMRVPPTADSGAHKMVSFIGASGGVGNTTMAFETAVFLASLKNKSRLTPSVAVVNLDFSRNSISDYLDLAPRLDLAELARDPDRLDNYMLEIFATRHSSGFDLFESKEPVHNLAKLDEAAVFSLLNCLEDNYGVVLLDVPATFVGPFDDVVKNSDLVFVTGRYTVPSVKQIARRLEHLHELEIPAEKTVVIINDCDSRFLGGFVKRSDIEAALPRYTINYVRDDRSFASDCVNSGISMVGTNPKRAICRDIKRIADLIEKLKSEKHESGVRYATR